MVMSNSCRTDVNCTFPHDVHVNYVYPKPNGDIAGTGVVIGFVGTAYLAFALFLVHCFVAYDPEMPPPSPKAQPSNCSPFANARLVENDWAPNPADLKLLNWVRRGVLGILRWCRIPHLVIGAARSEQIQKSFNKSVADLCDIQVVTGVSILIGGFVCLKEPISVHHWQLIVHLAWFSNNTHLSGLTILRRHLQAHDWERNVRVASMFVLVILLITAMIPTAFFNWRPSDSLVVMDSTGAYPDMPAICFFSISCGLLLLKENPKDVPFTRTSAFQEMLVSVLMLLIGFSSRTFKLSFRLSYLLRNRIGLPLNRASEVLVNKVDNVRLLVARDSSFTRLVHNLWSEVITRTLVTTTIVVRTQITLLNSMLGEILWLLVVLLWATSKLQDVLVNERNYEIIHSDNSATQGLSWQFGQLLPVFLLAAPLITMLGTFFSGTSSSETRRLISNPRICNHCQRRTSEPPEVTHTRAVTDRTEGLETTPPQEHQRRTQQLVNANHETADATAPEMLLSFSGFNATYGETQWILPYLATSLFALCVHEFFLLWFTTYFFDKEGVGLLALKLHWMAADYLFKVQGIFYLVLLSYPSAAHVIVLYGLTADKWHEAASTARSCVRQGILWLFAVLVHSLYMLAIYVPTQWNSTTRLWMVCSITTGFYVMYITICIIRYLVSLRKKVGDVSEANEASDHTLSS